MTDLGYIYEKGITNESGLEYIIEPHLDHSLKYYEKAKKEQFPRAMNNLGNLLISQNIISTSASQTSNLQKGIKYLESAVACKYPKALINLGKCYLTGTGTEVNSEKARGLFRDAAQLGDSQGRLEYIKSYIGTNIEEVTTMNELV
jgi:TPR repeat protein